MCHDLLKLEPCSSLGRRAVPFFPVRVSQNPQWKNNVYVVFSVENFLCHSAISFTVLKLNAGPEESKFLLIDHRPSLFPPVKISRSDCRIFIVTVLIIGALPSIKFLLFLKCTWKLFHDRSHPGPWQIQKNKNYLKHLFWSQRSKISCQLQKKKTMKNTNIWRLNNTLMNNQQITEEKNK